MDSQNCFFFSKCSVKRNPLYFFEQSSIKQKLVFKKITDMYEEPNPIEKWLDEQDRVIIEISASRVSGVIR